MSRNISEIQPKPDEIFRIGEFTFSLKTFELVDVTGNAIALRSQSADVLAQLALHSGELVSKDALIESVWTDTFVTDDSLVHCIGDIRRALGDTEHKHVQTYPKKGYKLVATPIGKEAAEPIEPVVPPSRILRFVFATILAAILGVFSWIYLTAQDSVTSHGEKPGIAILAFDDLSVGDDAGYLTDAIAEGIITELARYTLIFVTARNSSFRYRDSDADARQIGEELGVHYILEGSQQKSGDALRVTVQLIEAQSGKYLWSHVYDQTIGDLFTVQDQIIKTVADRIGVRIQRPVPGRDPDKVSALNLHLQSLAIIKDSFNEEAVRKNIELNEKAVLIDPDAHYGYVGQAQGYRAAAVFSWLGMDQSAALDKALGLAQKALELSPDDPEVHYALARIYTEQGEREQAMASYNKAIELNPSASNYLVGSTTPLLYAGETEEALKRLNQAMGIDPFHEDWFHWQMAWALWEIEDCEGALAAMLRMRTIPRGAQRMMSGIYACLGQVEKAQEAYRIFYAEAEEPTISEQREKWQDIWTAPGSLERWLEYMKIAGMKE
ncbi:winged helix-turn-helix domain-containing protein [Aliiroseovarius sp.]|uniref:winged helix-turn-helix domain-containing tetratricopeptide repeat protein n=1 Tax=Aliiroseovarius sp. TaxID=1872442 RepID=UPI0026050546|nr:winged helix-turn-helix domain-containing protein [Aliiroseovarius sp.]